MAAKQSFALDSDQPAFISSFAEKSAIKSLNQNIVDIQDDIHKYNIISNGLL